MDNKYVYAFITANNTVATVNYDTENNEVNRFLGLYELWAFNGVYKGEQKMDGERTSIWYEHHKSFMDILKSEQTEKAFKRMGVKLVFEYPFKTE